MFKGFDRLKSVLVALVLAVALTLSGCAAGTTPSAASPTPSQKETAQGAPNHLATDDGADAITTTATTYTVIDPGYTDRDKAGAYDAADAATITLSDGGTAVTGGGAAVEGDGVTITAEGVYILSGTLTSGRIVVQAADTDKVQLVLNNASITSADGPAIEILSADKVFITLPDGTQNTLADSATYTLAEGEDEPNACLYSKSDLTINGQGALGVTGNYAHGINSKDDLIITGGALSVTAVNDGVRGKDGVGILGGTLAIAAGGDGIQSSGKTDDETKGWISIDGGTLSITAGCDGIQAATVLQVLGGTMSMETGGGSKNASSSGNDDWGHWGFSQSTAQEDETTSTSAKGLKSDGAIFIQGGVLQLDSSDDSVHAVDVTLAGGTLGLASGDDGMHADRSMVIDGGTINITKSYEGIEGATIDINGGTINIVASDDGLNASGGNDASSLGGRAGQNQFAAVDGVYVRITGGMIHMDASGDGLDSNGELTVSGGTVIVSGPSNSGNGAIDYNGTGVITGGAVVALGASGMAQNFSADSTQCSVLVSFGSTAAAGAQMELVDADGNVLVSFTNAKQAQCAVISCPQLVEGSTYTVTLGGTAIATFEASMSTSSGEGMGGFGGGGGGKGGGGGQRPQGDLGGMTPPDGGGGNGQPPEPPAA